MTVYFHTLKDKKLDDVKKYLLDRYDSIEFIEEFENDIIRTSKIHNKNFEALIIINSDNIVKSCSVKYLNKIKSNNTCTIL
jgi:hypothetical protein